MTHYNKYSSYLIFKRWIDIIILSISGVTFWALFNKYLINISDTLYKIIDNWGIWIQISVIVAMCSVLMTVIIRLKGLHYSYLIPGTFFRFPPSFIAGIIGTILYAYIAPLPMIYHDNFLTNFMLKVLNLADRFLQNSDFGINLVMFIIIYIPLNIFLKNLESQLFITTEFKLIHSRDYSGLDSPKKIVEWLMCENPISSPEEDLLNLTPKALRVARIMLNNKQKTMGIIGSYGIGKSSLLNLIEYFFNHREYLSSILQKDDIVENNSIGKMDTIKRDMQFNNIDSDLFKGEIIICKIDGWGRSHGSVAKQILSILINKLSTKVDCASLVTIPSNYRTAMTGNSNILVSAFSAFAFGAQNSIDLLFRIDKILKIVNKRLIVFLEDVDRNCTVDIIRDEMPALLDRLRSMEYISFVLAIGTENNYSQMLVRVCDYTEYLS